LVAQVGFLVVAGKNLGVIFLPTIPVEIVFGCTGRFFGSGGKKF
jgi:hypothetical protein